MSVSRDLHVIEVTYTHQLPLPTPMTVMGEHVRPTRTLTSWTTMPRRPRRREAAGSLALVTVLQHCWVPLVHWFVLPPSVGTGVAAARMAREDAMAMGSLENIMVKKAECVE
jgi:hypothetical protein